MARHPRTSLLAPLQERILAVMLTRPSREWYRSELARELGVSPSSLQRPLAGLVRVGVVVASPDGNRVYYSVEIAHPILPELKGLVAKTSGVVIGTANDVKEIAPQSREIAKMSPEIRQRKAEIEHLCRRFHVRRLDLFGSAASESERAAQSDFDFLVEFESLPAGTYADAYFGLLEALEKLLGRPVDLVVGSAIRNPYFREAIEPTRVLLYAA